MNTNAINSFLRQHDLRIAQNPCVSPDFCLDWAALSARLVAGGAIKEWPKSHFATAAGEWTLLEDEGTGDCAWRLTTQAANGAGGVLTGGVRVGGGTMVFPATWENLLRLKNLVQEHDAGATIFPTSGAQLGRSTLGIGARFTTLHWPAVDWAMSALDLGVTANQNSIPRELVYDVNAMLEGRLDSVPFPFIGTNVPEGHQGQSVEGMSHGCVLAKLKSGFHQRRIAWSFNADHQPIGGKFDAREDDLVRGCLLASYITFDLSPELALNRPAVIADVPAAIVQQTRARVAQAGLALDDAAFGRLLGTVWPAMLKMKQRDDKYATARAAAFTTDIGRTYLRELSIDELPGLTTPETTAVMLALCEVLEMPVNFVAPAFGFQKNMPYPDNAALRTLIARQWAVCEKFGVSIGFHSGSGKSAENYRVMGEVTGSRLEIKTSGRYTYEMGVAIAQSRTAADQALWRDWYRFTLEMALAGAFSNDATEQKMARTFIVDPLVKCGSPLAHDDALLFGSPEATRAALEALPASPEHMFFFEYNFLYVLAAGGRPAKSSLGDHSPAGYQQRARFYAISPETQLLYAKGVARYIVFLAEATGLVPEETCASAKARLDGYATFAALVDEISEAPVAATR
ncbi:tagaturonate epimerase family protein [Horticoccus luteus]|uniref:tagaturonate epimerase family protein n=1 Tax=Horticoccus luteus TaxID=2862869 RepID=UPI002105CC97|nr:tagaturonate epimerase family protein [Horticoccus luteus]